MSQLLFFHTVLTHFETRLGQVRRAINESNTKRHYNVVPTQFQEKDIFYVHLHNIPMHSSQCAVILSFLIIAGYTAFMKFACLEPYRRQQDCYKADAECVKLKRFVTRTAMYAYTELIKKLPDFRAQITNDNNKAFCVYCSAS